ncbi:MAG: hypothetical protein ACYSTY_04895, partial [Planctomycetota bacterium]
MSTSTLSMSVTALREARTDFGRQARRRKLELLAQCAACGLDDARLLRDYHDVLLFLAAYPDDREVRRRVESELLRLTAAARHHSSRRRSARTLAGSGIASTVVEAAFSVHILAWLARRFPRDVEIAWVDESAGDALDELLALCVPHVERDGLIDDQLSTRQWISMAKGGSTQSDAAWLAQLVHELSCSGELLDHLFNALDLHVRWTLNDEAFTRTLLRFPKRRPFYHTGPLERAASLKDLVCRPLPVGRALPEREGERMIDIACASLCLCGRETDPITYANPREVTVLTLDRGIDIAIYGMSPDRRQPIESFFGFLAAKNGVPVAYGGGWVFFDCAEIGINVFEAFRGGESRYLFGQILRAYHRHLGVRRFTVDPFQFGAGN